MSAHPSAPACPRCHRRIAAWKLEHCVYCGAAFPPDLKEGFQEPEALKWVERPGLPPEAARQIELMKVAPFGAERRPRPLLAAASLLSLPVFAGIFYLLYALVARYSPSSATLVLVAGAGFLIYRVWTVFKAARR